MIKMVCIEGPVWCKDRLIIDKGQSLYARVTSENSRSLKATAIVTGLPIYINKKKYKFEYIRRWV